MTTAFHVSQGGLGPAVDLTVNDAWGEHSRKQALVTAGIIDKHLSDGREWIVGGKEPTAADITLCTAMASGKSDDFKLVRSRIRL
jgi:glutathione S-transferase